MKNLFLYLFLFIPASLMAQKSNLEDLRNSIEKKMRQVEGNFAVAFKDLQNGKTLLINEKDIFHAASTMKTPVMIEIYRQAAEGRFKLSDSILVKNEFKSIVDGSPFSLDISDDSADGIYKKTGQKMTIYDLTYQMITVSSNLATNILIDLVDAKNANASMRKIGAMDIQVLRGVEDDKAFQLKMNNVTTAYDLMLIFEHLALEKAVNKSASQEMMKILHDQKFNEIIPKKLPSTVRVAHKTGSVTGVQHDSGIVYLHDGRKYVLILLSKNLKDKEAGIKALSEVSEMIFHHSK